MTTEMHPGTLYTPSTDHIPNSELQWGQPSPTQHRRTYSSTSMMNAKGTMATIHRFKRHIRRQINKMTRAQKIVAAILSVITLVVGLVVTIYHERIFRAFLPVANKIRDTPGGWLIIFFMCYFSAFPPLMGYSTSVTLSGFIYGFPNGWFCIAAGTVLGSTSSFIACRLFFRNFAKRILDSDPRFAALALTLKHDGLKLLCMIRLTPLPYALSNASLSGLAVSTWGFAFATALATPKLLIHVYVGSVLYKIADTGSKMDTKTKVINYLSLVFGIILGITTGIIIYRRTMRRARVLEEQERARAQGFDGAVPGDNDDEDDDLSRNLFSDEPIDREPARTVMYDEEVGGRGIRRSIDNATIKIKKGRDVLRGSINAIGSIFTDMDEDESPEDRRLLDDVEDGVDAEELANVDILSSSTGSGSSRGGSVPDHNNDLI